ncbi:uncharacterized protein SCHCODRAFT_02537945 [Schizophyllum commune H4-8]|nr:uncharacterized protein SCHCODRAFT_02537945 [Schizophyllum commune H4-8]KAI5893225.1 hypothetical protein SCHCODRAFT_02537945 [Schizophyllum commune H4-8]
MATYADSDGTQSAPSRAHNLPIIYQPDSHLGIEWATSTTVTQPLLVLPDLDHSDDQLMRNAQADKMDEYIASIYTHITTIKSRRNMLLPVSQLPDEILTDIFLLVACRPDTAYPGHIDYWSRLMLVCRRWRIVGVSSPVLWSHMYIYPAHLSRLLLPPPHQRRLCGTHPLTVTVEMLESLLEDFRSGWTCLEILANYFHSLTIRGSEACLDTIVGLFSASQRENLRVLSVDRTRETRAFDDVPFLIPAEASKNIASNLRVLHLADVALDWNVLQNLTSVDISCFPDEDAPEKPSPLTPPLLLNMLRRSPTLKSLAISTFFDAAVLVAPQEPVDLPRLISLHFSARALTCAFILSALHIPPETHITVYSNYWGETEDNYQPLFEALRRCLTRPEVPALRTLKLPGEYRWAWYTDPPCDGLESSPNLVFHVLFSNNEEVHQRLVTQALRAIPSEKIEYLESGESYSVPKRDVCRLLLSLLPSLKTLAFCLRPYGRDQWLIVLRECAASTFNKKLTTILLRDEEGGRPFVLPRHYVSEITANLRDLLDIYVTHGRSVDKFVIRANWLEHGKEEVENFAEYARALGVEVDISSVATFGAILLGAPKEAEEAT